MLLYGAVAPLLPHYVDTLELSKAQAGLLVGSYSAGLLLSALPLGFARHASVHRPLLVAGLSGNRERRVRLGEHAGRAGRRSLRAGRRRVGVLDWSADLARPGRPAGAARRADRRQPRSRRRRRGARAGARLVGVGDEPRSRLQRVRRRRRRGRVPRVAVGRRAHRRRGRPGLRQSLGAPPRRRRLDGVRAGAVDRHRRLRRARSAGTRRARRHGLVAIGAVFITASLAIAVANPVVGRWSDAHGRRLPIVFGFAAGVLGTSLLALSIPSGLYVVVVLATFVALGCVRAPTLANLTESAEGRARRGGGVGIVDVGMRQAWWRAPSAAARPRRRAVTTPS